MNKYLFFNLRAINKTFVLLVMILVLGFILRTYNLNSNPPGFFCDEASIGYNAFSILQTGKDEYGEAFPVFFRSFGDFRHPLAVYFSIPFVAILGLNEVAVRAHAVFFGLISILVLYFSGKRIYSTNLGLLTAFIASVLPWLIHYNRTGFEFTIYSTFFLSVILLFIYAERDRRFIIPAFILASLTFYTYQPAKLLIPLLLAGLIFIFRKKFFEFKKQFIIGCILFSALSLPMIYSFISGEAFARFDQVSVLAADLTPRDTVKLFLSNYFTQLDPMYFIRGEDTRITRHFTGGLLPILQVTLPFLLIGVIYIFITYKNKSSQILIFWLFIYPIAGAITLEPPFTSRSIIGAGLVAILISIGIIKTYNLGRKIFNGAVLISALCLLIVINLKIFIGFYFVEYPKYSADFWGWQYGPREIVSHFAENRGSYDDFFIANDFNAGYIFFEFYAAKNCSRCRIGSPDTSYSKERRQLFALTKEYIHNFPNYNYKPVKTIYYPNGTPAFILTEIAN